MIEKLRDIRELLLDLAAEQSAYADKYGEHLNDPFEPGGRGYQACELVSGLIRELEERDA
jgi:hypothetical protein